jgi:GTP-binding protein EngB required for normal cell division
LSGDRDSNSPRNSSGLNESHIRRLLANLQYADKLLSEIEGVLTASSSGSPFPKYTADLTPAQARMIRDYSVRFRTQMRRILDGMGIPIPGPQFGAIHSIRINLAFIRVALQESSPKDLSGYGPPPESLIPELNGFSEELQGLLNQLDAYLAQGPGHDLAARIESLTSAGARTGLLTELERIVSDHGLVEFRPALSTIVDRLSSDRFEIAVFGQVSSGKSSLLNRIIGAAALPVGVNPITAIPTRIVYGPAPRLIASFADRQVKILDADQIAEYATEQRNPANRKGVVRLTLEYPSARLRDGIVFVDTPGLGSLATAGAEETRSYLPRCDLAVVLINAASPLGEADVQLLGTIQAAAIPTRVLLSKVDLLGPDEEREVAAYISEQLHRQLGVDAPVHPVSVVDRYAHLLDSWFQDEIAPLYERHQQLRQESIQRKTGLLREAVEQSLRAAIQRAEHRAAPANAEALRDAEKELRSAAGLFTETEARCLAMSDEIRDLRPVAIEWAASRVIESWDRGENRSAEVIVRQAISEVATEFASRIVRALQELSGQAADALQRTSAALGGDDAASRDELAAPIRETPQIDLGDLALEVNQPFWRFLGKRMTRTIVKGRLGASAGDRLDAALASFSRLLLAWVRTVLSRMRPAFDVHAEAWRAQIERQIGTESSSGGRREQMIEDLRRISSLDDQNAAGSLAGQVLGRAAPDVLVDS